MDTVTDLRNFYNVHAEKYYHTRKKFWTDSEFFLKIIHEYCAKYQKKNLKILEFGCGGGRFTRDVLLEIDTISIEYVGVDISQSLLNFARQDYLSGTFICADISDFITGVKQEEFDIIVGIASFQHIFPHNKRVILMKCFYRALNYNGILLLQNWSFSWWFIRKYQRHIFFSVLEYIKSLGGKSRNDVFIPWQTGNKVFSRYYHIFTLSELKILCRQSGFVLKKLSYIGKGGKFISRFGDAKTSLLQAQKSITY